MKRKTHKDVIDDINHDGLVLTHAIAHVMAADPKAVIPRDCVESFPKQALSFYTRHVDVSNDPEFDEQRFRMMFDLRPDLFSIDDSNRDIILHEIEDTHPMPHDKLVKIIRAFDYFDAECLGLKLFVYDRYGLNKREINIGLLTTMVGTAK